MFVCVVCLASVITVALSPYEYKWVMVAYMVICCLIKDLLLRFLPGKENRKYRWPILIGLYVIVTVIAIYLALTGTGAAYCPA